MSDERCPGCGARGGPYSGHMYGCPWATAYWAANGDIGDAVIHADAHWRDHFRINAGDWLTNMLGFTFRAEVGMTGRLNELRLQYRPAWPDEIAKAQGAASVTAKILATHEGGEIIPVTKAEMDAIRPPAPFKITGPGKYRTRDGREAIVSHELPWKRGHGGYPWRGQCFGTWSWLDDGFSRKGGICYGKDLIARIDDQGAGAGNAVEAVSAATAAADRSEASPSPAPELSEHERMREFFFPKPKPYFPKPVPMPMPSWEPCACCHGRGEIAHVALRRGAVCPECGDGIYRGSGRHEGRRK